MRPAAAVAVACLAALARPAGALEEPRRESPPPGRRLTTAQALLWIGLYPDEVARFVERLGAFVLELAKAQILLRVAANQQTTRDWWGNHHRRFDLFVSRFVVDECADGDPVAAQERLLYLHGIPLVKISDDVTSLAASLVAGVPLPQKAVIDALHISAAAVNGVEYLLTWNCRHIANPSLRPQIEGICRRMGFEPPVICTPQEVLEIDDGI